MGSVEFDQSCSCSDGMSIDQLVSSAACSLFGDPKILPRLGDKYQVQIPPLIGRSDYALYKKNPAEFDNRVDSPFNFLMGLPVPLTKINRGFGAVKHETSEFLEALDISSKRSGSFETEHVKKTHFCLDEENSSADDGPAVTGSGNPDFEEKQQRHADIDYELVPGSVVNAWSDCEKRSFLLGLYIFRKNFVQLKKFVDGKRMGDILRFYYGKFYRSCEYQRWSEYRKKKGKRCVYGQKIFTGFRQQELVSRLFSRVSEECQNGLSKVSKMFAEGKMSLEDYVFSLKGMVGMDIFVEAIGIGKGKQDLTCMAIETLRSSQVIPLRSDIPVGKACAALEPCEIIKFLTGDYRLSKARTSDLFWEAVWPRLLARGWQSKQPKNSGKDCLVFLVPGVNTFSRRRLVKGKQYFDSVTDILSKVALEPSLLELDTGEGEGNIKGEEDEHPPKMKAEQVDISTCKLPCYLQPRTQSQNTNTQAMKFMVVDTSLTDCEPYKFKELRSLPFEVSTSGNHSEVSDGFTSEGSSDFSEAVIAMLVDEGNTNDASVGKSVLNGTIRERKDPGAISTPSLDEDNQSRKAINRHFSRRLKKNKIDHVGSPVTKRQRRLTACSRSETSNSSMCPEPEMLGCCPGISEFSNVELTLHASSSSKLSSTNSSQGVQSESIEGASVTDIHVGKHLHENTRTMTSVDLNVPRVSPDFKSGALLKISAEDQDDWTNKKPEDHTALKVFAEATTSGQQSEVGQRRHSKRSRPPTARALEALANGFLTVNSRPRKNKEISSQENLMPRLSEQTGGGHNWVIDLSAGSTESRINRRASLISNCGSDNIFTELQVSSEGNALPIPGCKSN